jgi:hypothetical protein
MTYIPIREATAAEGRALFERACRHHGTTAEEFLARYDAGETACWREGDDELLMLLPFSREVKPWSAT